MKSREDQGTIALIVAILVSSSLIIGLFVIVADTGALFSERRVIQNASDSADLALARECAVLGNGSTYGEFSGYSSNVCESQFNALDFAQKYANSNSEDSLTEIVSICGQSPLNICSNSEAFIYDCKNVDPKYIHFVRVRTATKTPTGNKLNNLFSSALNSNDPGTSVPGCSQSAWGKASFAPVFFPLALPICNYQLNGTLVLQDFSSNNPVVVGGCNIVDLDGKTFSYASPTEGFSLLSNMGCPGISSIQKINVGDFLNIESSLSQVEQQCPNGANQFYSQASTFLNTVFFVPVVTNVICQNTSTNCQGSYRFQVASFFAFKFLGLKFKNSGLLGVAPPCPPGDTCTKSTDFWPSYCTSTRNCVYGTFSRAAVPGADVSTDPNFPAVGAQAIQLLP